MLRIKTKNKKIVRHTVSQKHVYNDQRWRGKNGIRAYRLATDPFCKYCGDVATEVDHIKAINLGGDPFDFENTQSLCKSCHSGKSAREGRRKF